MLDDTVKNITDVEKNGVQRSEVSWQRTNTDLKKSQFDKFASAITSDKSFVDIHLPADKAPREQQWNVDNECKKQFTDVSIGEGYVNPAFVGSTDELTSLSFNRSAGKHSKIDKILIFFQTYFFITQFFTIILFLCV